MPDCLKPPNGVVTRTDVLELIEIVPVSSARATRIARPALFVQIDPESPYTVSLAIRIASASSANGITATIGPKISSRAARSVGATGESTVGGNQNPAPLGALPRKATFAPSSKYVATLERWAAEISGPISDFSSIGTPTRRAMIPT